MFTKTFFKKSIIIAFIFGAFIQSSSLVFAVPEEEEIPSLYPDKIIEKSDYIDTFVGVQNSDEANLEEGFMPTVMKFITGSVGVVAGIVMLIAGIRMITSFGDSEQRENAKKMLYYGILGIVFIVLAYAIVKGVTSLQFNKT